MSWNRSVPDEVSQWFGTAIMATIGIAIAGLILFGLTSSIYTVGTESKGVVLRFGKFQEIVDSGLRFKIPFGIDEVVILPVERQLKQEFGFYTSNATDPNQYSPTASERASERNFVTGDLNAASVEWIIQYRIIDPKQFLFEVREPEQTLRDISESVMRAVVGDRTVDEVITIGRQEIEAESLAKMQEVADKFQLGLVIEQVQLKNVNPPPPVQPSFNEVNQAQQKKEEMINIANGEYNKVIPRARGEAEQKIQEAEGYATKRINEAEGDVALFKSLYTEYLKAPEVTRQRLYFETMQEVMPRAGKKVILDSASTQILPLLPLNDSGKILPKKASP